MTRTLDWIQYTGQSEDSFGPAASKVATQVPQEVVVH